MLCLSLPDDRAQTVSRRRNQRFLVTSVSFALNPSCLQLSYNPYGSFLVLIAPSLPDMLDPARAEPCNANTRYYCHAEGPETRHLMHEVESTPGCLR